MTAQIPIRARPVHLSDESKDDRKKKRRYLWLMTPLIPACLWLISQAALFGLGANQVEDTILSNMAADYGHWGFQPVSPLKPELIGTIRADQATLIAGAQAFGTVVPFIPFGTGVYIAEVPSPTPTASPTRKPTSTPTATSTNTPFIVWPTWTPTDIPTLSPEATWIEPTAIPPTDPPPTSPPPPLPTIQLSSTIYSVNEAMVNATVVVMLSSASAQPITVTYTTSDGSATTPDDYGGITDVLMLSPGQTTGTFDIAIFNDTLIEGNETFQVTLTNPINATLGANHTATLTIIDDDPAVSCTGVSGTYTLAAPELSAADNSSLDIACGYAIMIELGSNPINANGDTDYDLIVHERQDGSTGNIEMDWIIVQVGTSSTGPWLTVFYWGDSGPDANTSLGRNGLSVAEADNELIAMTVPQLLAAPMAPFLITGVGIDVDALVPPGVYQWLRIFSPNGGGNDTAQVDYLQIITP
ncbi:MAG: hypothetical protein JXB07_09950 [Anaerolineae bacterium]|nr:hypothetical protein [Anaerolineae bacterium]